MLAEVSVKDPTLKAACNQMIEKEEKSLEEYGEKLSQVMMDTMQHFELSAVNSAASSRTSSPVRHETFRNMKHLLPSRNVQLWNSKSLRETLSHGLQRHILMG